MTPRLVSLLLGCAVGVGVASVPSGALAYRTAGELPDFEGSERVAWAGGEVSYRLNADGLDTIAFSRLEMAASRSFARWTSQSCADLDVRYAGSAGTPRSGDGASDIAWLGSRWMEQVGLPDTAGTTDLVYEKNADGEWEIVEADILLNADDYDWDFAIEGGDDARNIDAVLTHEIGHLLGLLHPCELDGVEGPVCMGDLARETTMYPTYTGAAQSMLSDDDIAGVCFLYPATCTGPDCTPCEPACGAGERCDAGSCVPDCASGACATTPWGDPCTQNEACAGGACDASGYCTGSCADGCPDGYHCGGETCVAGAGVFGEACNRGDACLSGICLNGAPGSDICTRPCDPDDTVCPSGTACFAIDGRNVCAPERMGNGGCTVASSTPDPSPLLVTLAMATIALGIRRRKTL